MVFDVFFFVCLKKTCKTQAWCDLNFSKIFLDFQTKCHVFWCSIQLNFDDTQFNATTF